MSGAGGKIIMKRQRNELLLLCLELAAQAWQASRASSWECGDIYSDNAVTPCGSLAYGKANSSSKDDKLIQLWTSTSTELAPDWHWWKGVTEITVPCILAYKQTVTKMPNFKCQLCH